MTDEQQYDRPIMVAEGVYWLGFQGLDYGLDCNPYLVTSGSQGVVIDAGSRPDFPVVMTKLLQTGQDPKLISHLIYQHYDPDLCGSLPNIIDFCANPSLKVLSHPANNVFLRYYTGPEHQHHFSSILAEDCNLILGERRRLRFTVTPYCHTNGSFITYDEQSKTLFTSDLFGSFSSRRNLYLELTEQCFTCRDFDHCPQGRSFCPLSGIIEFHRQIMPNGKALAHAMEAIKGLDIKLIAPQHGSLLNNRKQIHQLIELLADLDGIGIDHIC